LEVYSAFFGCALQAWCTTETKCWMLGQIILQGTIPSFGDPSKMEEYLVNCLTTFVSHILLPMTAGRNGTLGTWRRAFRHCGVWYQNNFNFLTLFRKRPTNDVDNQGNTGQIKGQHRSSTVILIFL
jgi:hypothetical protein